MGPKGKYSSQNYTYPLEGWETSVKGEGGQSFPMASVSLWHPAYMVSGSHTDQEAPTKLRNKSSRQKEDCAHSRRIYSGSHWETYFSKALPHH